MKVLFRLDSSCHIGSGHAMRCLAIAQHWRARGITVEFACRAHRDNRNAVLSARGFRVIEMPPGQPGYRAEARPFHAWWLGADWRDDADELRARLEGATYDLLVVDHFALDARWESAVRSVARRILVIDDLADRQHDCDFLLDYSFQRQPEARYRGLVPDSARLLLGPRYCPLGPRFAELSHLPRRDGPVATIGLFLGSGDVGGHTARAVGAWRRRRPPGARLKVLVSDAHPQFAWFTAQAAEEPSIEISALVPDPAEFLAGCDAFLGAGGVSVWERACLGVPTLTVAVAENQEVCCQGLVEEGYLAYLGRAGDLSDAEWEWAFATLSELPDTLREKTRRLRALADGQGLTRLTEAIFGDRTVVLRDPIAADARWVWEQRNQPEVRAASFDAAEIPWETHQAWFAETLRSSDRRLLIATAQGRDIGVLRFDREGEQAEVSIYLAAGEIGKGWGLHVLRAGNEWAEQHLPGISWLVARVREDNVASIAAFRAAGFSGEAPELRREIPARLRSIRRA